MQSTPSLRRARLSAMLAFATNGALLATLLARYAEVQDLLGVGTGLFGLLVVGYVLGGAGAFNLPGVVLRRFGMRATTTVGTTWVAAALFLAVVGIVMGQPWLFFAALVLAGAADTCVDVGQNAQGLRVQQGYGRSLMNFMHAGWSIGAALGGAVGTLMATLDVPLLAHIGLWGAVCIGSMWWASRGFLADGTAAAGDAPAESLRGRHVMKILVPLALVALAGISVEEIANNWSAILLATERGVPLGSAGIGLSVLLAAQFIGRLLGDRFIDALGSHRALLISLGVVVAGMLAAAWAPNAATTLLGLALAGLGCAVTVPVAFAEADAVPGLPPHAGVTWISWAMRAATITLAPTIGGIATLASLPVALTVVTGIAVVALVLQLGKRPRAGREAAS
ncbi:MFS transporter [Zhihengliuella salsuginis]|uniref:MFS transporter n=1 Tax=Zhihengliuella salsuginis TaxID=578222 RepID=A0ABQ3G9B7_9MICC|nr:MFS transporter [Zhihengliuella salsuginis]GHC98728.1 MFS transporter [Zhihengliuella salsuginis]